MASAADVILLSSSPDCIPSRTPAQPVYDPEKLFGLSPRSPSPPPLVSPSELFRPPVRSRFFKVKGQTDGTLHKENEVPEVPANEKGSTALKEKGTSSEGKPKRTRKKQVTSESHTTVDGLDPSENSSKKPAGLKNKRADSTAKRGQAKNKTITGRVAKSGGKQTKKSGAKTNEPSTPAFLSEEKTAKRADEWEKDGLQLEAAMKRRLDWTPTKNTTEEAFKLDDKGDAEGGQKRFGNLLSEYGFSGTTSVSLDTSKTSEDGGPTTRRRIELVDSKIHALAKRKSPDDDDDDDDDDEKPSTNDSFPLPTAPEAEKKPNRRGRKITTLTARVTARYASDATESLDTTISNTKSKRKGNSKAKSQDPDCFIFPPEDALKSLEEQGLIFGTCSQLAREDSPTMLRDLQTAIRMSESNMAAEVKSRPISRSGSRMLSSTAVSRPTTPRNLWSVAARDLDGALAQAEVLDMVDISDISELPPKPDDLQCNEKEQKNQDTGFGAGCESADSSLIEIPAPKEDLDVTGKREPTQNVKAVEEKPKETTFKASKSQRSMPEYASFTDAKLSKQVKAYGFKAVKSRKTMIELLEKCRESKHGTSAESGSQETQEIASGGLTLETALPQSQTEKKRCITNTPQKASAKSMTKPKSSGSSSPVTENHLSKGLSQGTGEKCIPQVKSNTTPSKLRFADVEEIEDSEDELIPSPSRVQSRYMRHTSEGNQSLPVSKTPSTPTRTNSNAHIKLSTPGAIAAASLPDLAAQITKAMRMQPRSSSVGCKRPSWHEKILMYDPIILEDFATWLNTEGLELVNEDREVSAEFVREWCERNGICCCFRKNTVR